MKKITGLLLIFMFIAILHAEPFHTFRFGFLIPQDVNIGTITGYGYGANYDNITIFASGDLFYRNHSSLKKIGYQSDTSNHTVVVIAKTSAVQTYYVPLELNGQFNIPTPDSDFKFYAGGGFGLGMLWQYVFVVGDSNHDPVNETKFYSGLNWNLRAGARYPIGRNTALTGEIFVNNGRMRRDIVVTPIGITWNEINMGGVGLRVGLEIPSFASSTHTRYRD